MQCSTKCNFYPYTNPFIESQKWRKEFFMCPRHGHIHWCVLDPKYCILDDEGMTCLFTNRQSQNQINLVCDVYMTDNCRLDEDKSTTNFKKMELFDNYTTFKRCILNDVGKYEQCSSIPDDKIESDIQTVYTTLSDKTMMADYKSDTIIEFITISLMLKYHPTDRYFTDRTIRSIGKTSWRDNQLRKFIDNIINT